MTNSNEYEYLISTPIPTPLPMPSMNIIFQKTDDFKIVRTTKEYSINENYIQAWDRVFIRLNESPVYDGNYIIYKALEDNCIINLYEKDGELSDGYTGGWFNLSKSDSGTAMYNF